MSVIKTTGADLQKIANKAYAKYATDKGEKSLLPLKKAVFRTLQGLTVRKFPLHTMPTIRKMLRKSSEKLCRVLMRRL